MKETGPGHLYQMAFDWGDPLPCCGCALARCNQESLRLCDCRCHDSARLVTRIPFEVGS